MICENVDIRQRLYAQSVPVTGECLCTCRMALRCRSAHVCRRKALFCTKAGICRVLMPGQRSLRAIVVVWWEPGAGGCRGNVDGVARRSIFVAGVNPARRGSGGEIRYTKGNQHPQNITAVLQGERQKEGNNSKAE